MIIEPQSDAEYNQHIRDAQSMTTDVLAQKLEYLLPETWKRVNVKSIDCPGSHHGFKYLSVGLVTAAQEFVLSKGQTGHGGNLMGILSHLAECNYPTYYVSKPLMEALAKSKPPENMTWQDVPLGYPAISFMLPTGALIDPKGYSVGAITIARFKVGEKVQVPGIRGTVTMPTDWTEDRISVAWFCGNGMISQDCTFLASSPLQPNAAWLDAKTLELRHLNGYTEGKADTVFSTFMVALTASLLMVMNARPELVETPSTKPYRLPKSGLTREAPRYLGRKYITLRKDHTPGVTGLHFTELGWRAGHFKRVYFGTGRKESKIIWIDPYIAYTRGLKST